MSATLEQRLAELAELAETHRARTAAIRRMVAGLLADDAGWTAVATALGVSRQVVRTQFLDWAHYRNLNRARNRAAVE